MEHFDSVDEYVAASASWPAEVAALREVLLGCGLDEAVKWGKPCYLQAGRNIAIVQEFKDFLALMFFKGALLADPDGALESQGPNSRSAMRMRFTSVDDVTRRADQVAALVAEAVRVEDEGLTVAPTDLVLVAELQERLDADPALRAAFEALTPGRQRQYDLHVGEAKRAETRRARVDASVERILAGKGLRDR